MRRFLTCILTLAALLALTAPARADILWEPDDNAFYKSHREECSAEDRAYIANGGDGFMPNGRYTVALYNLSRRRNPSIDGKHKRTQKLCNFYEINKIAHNDFIKNRTVNINFII